jgi:methylmalonyl-CoA/ethylmalonyl-CoA epimerase
MTAHGNGIGLRGIDHVGIAVPDLDAAITRYEKIFGMRCVHTEENAEQGVREAMMAFTPATDTPVVGDPDSDGAEAGGAGSGGAHPGGLVQLLAPLSASSPIARFLDKSGPGIQQIAYTVDNLDETCAELRSRGVRLLYETPRRGTAGARVNFLHPRDAGGVLVELVEPAPHP